MTIKSEKVPRAPSAGTPSELSCSTAVADDLQVSKPAPPVQAISPARHAYRCQSRVRRTRLAMVRDAAAKAARQRLAAGDYNSAVFLIRRLQAFSDFVANCAGDFGALGKPGGVP
jgi:hypothetical protein